MSSSVSDFMGCRLREGRVFGVEIEVEGENLPQRETELVTHDPDEDYPEYEEVDRTPELGAWEIHAEGSIKGAEYVLKEPLPLSESLDAVGWLFNTLRTEWHAVIYDSPRTSVHVHVNASDWSWDQLRKALPLLAVAEPFLVEISGKHRKGNLFCLSRLDAPFGWTPIINAICGKHYNGDTHYSGINFAPLWRKGSIEFRMMRGLTEAADVVDWLVTLDSLIDAIDLLPDDYDYEEFPPVLAFLTSSVPAEKIKKLEREGLRSAREVLADLTIAAVSLPQPSPLMPTFTISGNSIEWNPMAEIPIATAMPNISATMTDEQILAAIDALNIPAPEPYF